jgi:hypothetical protein
MELAEAPCPSCGKTFSSLSMHWWHGSCPYPDIGERKQEVIVGLLMGDGSIPTVDGNHSFRVPMINRHFLSWYDEEMSYLTTGVGLVHTAEQLASTNRETGFSPNAERENYHDMYVVRTRTHPYFNELRMWYKTGRKRFPDNIELTPILAKYWYASDGYLDVGRWGRPRIEIKCRNEHGRAEFLVQLFEDVGFSPVFKRHELRFTCDDTERLVEWMGDPLPGFEYKWEIGSIERYHELKERAYTEYTTQTFEN